MEKGEIRARIKDLVDNRDYNVWICVHTITREDPTLTDKDVADVYYEMYEVLPRHRATFSDTNTWEE